MAVGVGVAVGLAAGSGVGVGGGSGVAVSMMRVMSVVGEPVYRLQSALVRVPIAMTPMPPRTIHLLWKSRQRKPWRCGRLS